MANDLSLYDRADWWNPADGFHLLNHLNPGRFKFFDRFVPNWAGLRVLDIGCGGGFTCEFLARRGAMVSGMDLSEASLAQARAHALLDGLEIEYTQGHAEHLPYADGQFDAVICLDVLEHIPNWEGAVAEVARVLAPGGRFFFDTINRNLLSRVVMITILENLLRLIPRGTHDHRLFIKPAELRRALSSVGLAIEATTGMVVGWDPLRRRSCALPGGPCSIVYLGCAGRAPVCTERSS